MAETMKIPAKLRTVSGTREARRLRAAGQVPAVVYGHKQETVPVTIDGDAIVTVLRQGAYGLLELDIEGAKETAVIKELQWDAFGRDVLHVDFTRVSADEKVTVEVPIALRGTSPGVNQGGVLDQPLREMAIECSAADIVQSITVNVNNLQMDESLLVKDIPVPEGVRLMADPDQVVVQVVTPTASEEADEEAPSSAEPELIRREESAADE